MPKINFNLCVTCKMVIDWNIKKVKEQIDKIVFAATDPKMDGYTTWGAKKDLYKILWYAEDKLKECSTYHDEDKFVKKRKQKKLVELIQNSDDY